MKTTIKLLMALIFIITITNCSKIKERKKTVINLSVLNSITKEGSLYSGIRYELVKRTKPNKINKINMFAYPSTKDEIICEGTTDSEGKATIEFFRVINHKRVKYILFLKLYEAGLYVVPYGYQRTYFVDIAQDKTNNAVYYLGEKVSLVKHIKNTNCFDANDKAIYKVENGIYTGSVSFGFGTYEFDSCYDNTFNRTLVEDYYPYTKAITRNGVVTVTRDTFKIEQGMDTLKWYY